jgi:aminoglycoside phosphotransferase (APT) family kinase protein
MAPKPPQHRLEWKYELSDVIPSWTVEPDTAIAKAIAIRHLPVTPSSFGIRLLSAGTFSKQFLLHPLGDAGAGATPESFILRVNLPVDPYFKTASEVATLQFVRKSTSVPVPRVIAFDSSADNELGFEWILVTKLPGVALEPLWESPELAWESRVRLTKTLAGYVKQLTSFKFPVMGSLYPSSRPEFERIAWLKHISSETRFVPFPDDAEFAIGPVTTIPFFYGDRLNLQKGRGPFETSSSYLTSLLHLHISSTTNRKIAVSTSDDDDVSEFDDAISAYESLFSVLPIFFPPEASNADAETFSLFHDDLSSDNILVDPTTHRITGIVDWECVSLQPSWEFAARVPQLLEEGPEVIGDDGSPIPDAASPPEEGADGFHRELRERFEQMLLRRIFYDEMGGEPERGSRERLFENKMQQVDVRPTAVRNWANGVLHEAQAAAMKCS